MFRVSAILSTQVTVRYPQKKKKKENNKKIENQITLKEKINVIKIVFRLVIININITRKM